MIFRFRLFFESTEQETAKAVMEEEWDGMIFYVITKKVIEGCAIKKWNITGKSF